MDDLKLKCGNPKCQSDSLLVYDKDKKVFYCPDCYFEVRANDKKKIRELNDKGDTRQTKLEV